MARLSMKVNARSFDIVFRGQNILSPELRAKSFANMAKQQIADVNRNNAALAGVPIPYSTWIDRQKTGDFSRVKEDSLIIAEWELAFDVFTWIWETLEKVGPSKSGRYRKTILAYADGKFVHSLTDAVGAKEILILPSVPYARKIERGKKGYAPGAVYQTVVAMANSRFSNVARIKFTYAEPPTRTPMLDKWAKQNAGSERHPRKNAAKFNSNRRQPAIIIYT